MPLKLEHRIGITASVEQVWEVLADVPGWAAWNPLYPKADGEIKIGQVLKLKVVIDGQPAREIEPVILDWAPYDHVHWKLKAMNGLINSIRYLELEKMSETSCIFSNGELFQGIVAPILVRPIRRQIRAGFEAMGEALKKRVEETISV